MATTSSKRRPAMASSAVSLYSPSTKRVWRMPSSGGVSTTRASASSGVCCLLGGEVLVDPQPRVDLGAGELRRRRCRRWAAHAGPQTTALVPKSQANGAGGRRGPNSMRYIRPSFSRGASSLTRLPERRAGAGGHVGVAAGVDDDPGQQRLPAGLVLHDHAADAAVLHDAVAEPRVEHHVHAGVAAELHRDVLELLRVDGVAVLELPRLGGVALLRIGALARGRPGP